MTRILIVAALLLMSNVCAAQKKTFDKWSDHEGVNVVYISKMMLRLIPNMKVGNADIDNIASKLDHVRILNCENAKKVKAVKADVEKELTAGGSEVIMDMKEGGEGNTVRIYHRKVEKKKNEFVLVQTDGRELTVINLKGTLSLTDIKNQNF